MTKNETITSFEQINLCQKLLFLHQLTHNMTTDCFLIWKLQAHNVLSMFCACSFHGNCKNNLLSYCGLVHATISPSEKDLSVNKLRVKRKKLQFYSIKEQQARKPNTTLWNRRMFKKVDWYCPILPSFQWVTKGKAVKVKDWNEHPLSMNHQ